MLVLMAVFVMMMSVIMPALGVIVVMAVVVIAACMIVMMFVGRFVELVLQALHVRIVGVLDGPD